MTAGKVSHRLSDYRRECWTCWCLLLLLLLLLRVIPLYNRITHYSHPHSIVPVGDNLHVRPLIHRQNALAERLPSSQEIL